MYGQLQGTSIVVTRRADKESRNASDSVAKYQDRTQMDFKPLKRCSDWGMLLIEQSDPISARIVFLNAIHEIKRLTPDILRIVINWILLYNFPRKSCTLPKGGTPYTSETTRLGYYMLKQQKSQLSEQRKQAKLQLFQNPSQINGDNPNNTRCEPSRLSGEKKKKGYLKDKIHELETETENKNIIHVYRGTNEFKDYQPWINLVEDENANYL